MQTKWLFVVLILTTISIGKLNSQTNIDTLNLSETFLEERHLRYMYNFALNNSFFQYRSGLLYRIGIPELLNSPKENRKILVYDKVSPFDLRSLELFIRPDKLDEALFLDNLDYRLESISLVSQFDIDFLKRVDNEIKTEVIHDKIFGDSFLNYFVEFSNVMIRNNKIYLSIKIRFPVNYDPNLILGNYQIYEFEWCESLGWVYPRRVSKYDFNVVYDMNKPRSGGTLKITSLDCP